MTDDAHIDPTREAFEAFKALPRDEPIEMLNLVAFREKAAYPADHPAAAEDLTAWRPIGATGPRAARFWRRSAARSSGAAAWTSC